MPGLVAQPEADEIQRRKSGQQRRYAWDYDEHYEIYVFNDRTGAYVNVTGTRGYDAEGSFSPDGKRICWRRFSENGATAEILTMNIDGSDQRQLTSTRDHQR